MSDASNAVEVYSSYLRDICPGIDPGIVSETLACLENTEWDDPQSVDDFNHIAVIALIEAEYCDDLTVRQLYVDMALEAFNSSLSIEKNCVALAHLSFLMSMVGDRSQAVNLAWDGWLTLTAHKSDIKHQCALIYLPVVRSSLATYRAEVIANFLGEESLAQRQVLLMSEALCFSSLVFYNQTGMRWLQLARGVNPDSAGVNLKLGAAMCTAKQWEGIYYLSHAQKVLPHDVRLIQALYLACRDVGRLAEAGEWLALAQDSCSVSSNPSAKWASLGVKSPFTYVAFDDNVALAVEASFKSLVTSVLVAEGDWFEAEMEFWRNWLKPAMTVIDVGANVGVYTFSAANQVGEMGRVLAVEPFSGCVRCLQETCQINGFDWVTVCAGAASNRQGTARLSLSSSSELNELVMDDQVTSNFEEVACFTLDGLFEQEGLNRVDIIKIDAEGHELAVLAGGEQILSTFSPVILYENIAGSQGSNEAVAEYLVSIGYGLFRYQPYVKELIPIQNIGEIGGSLNIIAKRTKAVGDKNTNFNLSLHINEKTNEQKDDFQKKDNDQLNDQWQDNTKIIWVCGMARSGSMWTFNITKEVLRLEGFNVYPEDVPKYKEQSFAQAEIALVNTEDQDKWVLKVHGILSPTLPRSKFIFTKRDLRDALISYRRFMDCSFERALNAMVSCGKTIDYYKKFPSNNILILDYDELLNSPADVIKKVAHFLDIDIKRNDCLTISEKFSRRKIKNALFVKHQEVEKKLKSKIEVDDKTIVTVGEKWRAFDSKTGFQSNHIDDTYQPGDWRYLLNESEQKIMKKVLSKYINED